MILAFAAVVINKRKQNADKRGEKEKPMLTKEVSKHPERFDDMHATSLLG